MVPALLVRKQGTHPTWEKHEIAYSVTIDYFRRNKNEFTRILVKSDKRNNAYDKANRASIKFVVA